MTSFFLLFWFFFIYTPINNKIVATNTEIHNLQNQCKQFCKITSACNTLKKSVDELRSDISVYAVKDTKNYFQSQFPDFQG